MIEEHLNALREVAENLEQANNLSDRRQRAIDRDAAYRAATRAFAAIFGDAALERCAAAYADREPTEPEGVGPEALIVARGVVDKVVLEHKNGPVAARNAIARLILDHSALLSPELAIQAALGLYLLNMGDGQTSPIFKPQKIKGLSKEGKSRNHIRRYVLIARLYYQAGYDGDSIEKTLNKYGAFNNMAVDTMRRTVSRESWKPQMHKHLESGAMDATAGRPASPQIAADFSLKQLEALEDELSKKA